MWRLELKKKRKKKKEVGKRGIRIHLQVYLATQIPASPASGGFGIEAHEAVVNFSGFSLALDFPTKLVDQSR